MYNLPSQFSSIFHIPLAKLFNVATATKLSNTQGHVSNSDDRLSYKERDNQSRDTDVEPRKLGFPLCAGQSQPAESRRLSHLQKNTYPGCRV